MFSSTVSCEITAWPSGTWAIPDRTIASGDEPTSSRPFHVIDPLSGFTKAEIVRSNVLFPAPLAPMTVVIFPCSAENETLFNAFTEP